MPIAADDELGEALLCHRDVFVILGISANNAIPYFAFDDNCEEGKHFDPSPQLLVGQTDTETNARVECDPPNFFPNPRRENELKGSIAQ